MPQVPRARRAAGAKRAEKRLQHAEGEAQPVREIATTSGATRRELLENQRLDERLGQPRFLERIRLRRPEISSAKTVARTGESN